MIRRVNKHARLHQARFAHQHSGSRYRAQHRFRRAFALLPLVHISTRSPSPPLRASPRSAPRGSISSRIFVASAFARSPTASIATARARNSMHSRSNSYFLRRAAYSASLFSGAARRSITRISCALAQISSSLTGSAWTVTVDDNQWTGGSTRRKTAIKI